MRNSPNINRQEDLTMLDSQTRLRKLSQRLGVIGICCLLPIGCGGKIARTPFEATSRSGVVIDSVQLGTFSGNYGPKLAELVKNNITREGYIKVVDRGGQTILTGTVTVGTVDKKSHHESYQTEDKDGRKVTKYTYYHRKQLTTQATYSLKKRGKAIAGNNFTARYDRRWSSSDNASAAIAQAVSDDQIVVSTLNDLAWQISAAVSPHKETLSFTLPCTALTDYLWCWKRPPSLKLGNEYYDKGRYDQAEKYWQQAIQESPEPYYQAAAYYSLGVLKVHDKQYGKAFEFFTKADELDPGNKVFMRALSKAENAGWHKIKIDESGFKQMSHNSPLPTRSYAADKYHLTVSARPHDSTIKIMNIKPKYRPGIMLKPGQYEIQVSRRGYYTKTEWVDITDDDLSIKIKLKKKR
jgi:tetratricopeptide (TPR) repeat protein